MGAKKSKSFLVSSSMASLPDEILISHVFVRLSVRSLSHCRCVCKQWNRFLTDPYFISIHLKHQKIHHNQNILCGPVVYKQGLTSDSEEDRAKYLALYGLFYSVHVQSTEEAVAVRLPGFPFLLNNYLFCRTMCYCNGIVCIQVYNKLEKDMTKSKHLLFGNPSTGDYKVLPDPVPISLFIGFTYDSSVDDYLCVIVDNITRNPHIYSLKLNSWRTNLGSSDKGAIEREICEGHNVGVALDRSIYWANRNSNSNFIVEFNFKDEEFRRLPLPTEMPKTCLSLKTVGGSVCIINVCPRGTGQVDMWLMSKQEEEEEKWSKLMSLNLYELYGYFKINPLCFTRDGEVLCSMEYGSFENSLVVIDPKTESVEDVTVRDEETGGDWLEELYFEGQHMSYINALISPN